MFYRDGVAREIPEVGWELATVDLTPNMYTYSAYAQLLMHVNNTLLNIDCFLCTNAVFSCPCR